MSYQFVNGGSDRMQQTYNYTFERLLNDGRWVKLGGIMVAPDEETVRQYIEKQEKGNEIRIVSITRS